MAVQPIRIIGDPVLHSVASEVTAFDADLARIAADMFETMDAAPGVGLAGPQIGVPLRLFTYGWTDEHKVARRGVAVNPELWLSPTPAGPADPEEDSEGCLSFPGERFDLRRAHRARLRARDVTGVFFEIEAIGWLARIFQHEYDHLDGTLYVDRLDAADRKVVQKISRKRGWGVPGEQWMPGCDHLDD